MRNFSASFSNEIKNNKKIFIKQFKNLEEHK